MDLVNQPFESRIDLSRLTNFAESVKREIGKVIVGQKDLVDLLLAALLADGHVLIEGVPGVAKTLTAKILSKTLEIPYSRIQFTPDLMPSDIIGTSVFNVKESDFEFHHGPIFSSLVLIDEVNRAPAKTQSALFEAMQEKQITVEGVTRKLGPPFLVVATQNPIEQEGTYRLPEAQLDRFLFKIEVDYPTLENETRIIQEYHDRGLQGNDPDSIDSVEVVASGSTVLELQALTRSVIVDNKISRYIAELIATTREDPALYLGASPRASISVMSASQAVAALAGRDFVTPDDVRQILAPTIKHRILLTPEKEMEGVVPDVVVAGIVERVEVPR